MTGSSFMRYDVDRTLKVLLTIIMAAVIGFVCWQIVLRVVYPLMLFLMGAIVAFILSPAVKRLHQTGIPKPLAILMVYIAVLGALSVVGYFLVTPLIDQIKTLTNNVPKQLDQMQPQVNKLLNALDKWLQKEKLGSLDKVKAQASAYVTSFGSDAVNNLTALVQASFNFLVNMVLTLVIAFYLLLDGERLKERVYELIPDSQLSRVVFVDATINEVLGGYLRGQLLMGLTIGTMAGVGTAILGVQYPVLIGVLSAILELVPMLGPWLSSMPAIAIAAVSGNPWPLTLWVGLYFLLIQQLESNVIGPRITGHAVGLHPLGALMALLVGIELDGIIGALFAVPVAGMLYVISMAVYFNITGRPQPVPVRKPPSPPWFVEFAHNLSRNTLGRQSGELSNEARASQISDSRLRRWALGNVPERLANVEQARDALLRPILHQRQMAHSEAEALDVGPPDMHHDEPPTDMSDEGEREREPQASGSTR